ncbi:hypothetical protein OHI65_19410 [Brucella sp. MAB-22]|uniref:hypothetical protein n=1 Tax=Brucella sp. MAB-22 TaxID=2986424 RepID=UPI00221ED4D1|nr:hypothetical protein [Brucella sp. MAB-22]UYT56159.1 hypothetical protein OHI65_19410 [Brucella sp. MAB-22]
MATVAQINGQLEALSIHVAECENKARELAFQAVSGDKEASAELARMNAEVKRANEDKLVLEQARITAAQREAEAAAANDAESRARHMDDARVAAGKLVDLADRADKLIAEFFALSEEIDAVEREVRRSLVTAKHNAIGGFFGRNGLSEIALDRMDVKIRGLRVSDKRDVGEIAAAAWRFLLNDHKDKRAA